MRVETKNTFVVRLEVEHKLVKTPDNVVGLHYAQAEFDVVADDGEQAVDIARAALAQRVKQRKLELRGAVVESVSGSNLISVNRGDPVWSMETGE